MKRGTVGLIGRVLAVGSLPTDDDETRLRKRGLMLTVWAIVLLGSPWGIVYLALGRPLSAAIPGAYVVASLAGIAIIARRGWTDHFRTSQIMLILFLPALLQWSLGGFIYGSAVIVWAFAGAMSAFIFASRRQATLAFGLFVALVLISGVLDARLMEAAEPLAAPVIRLFFVMNIVAVGIVAAAGFFYFTHQRDADQAELRTALAALDAERARSDGLLRNILPDSVADRLKDGHQIVADRYEAVTVVFADIVGFAPMAARLPPDDVVSLLDGVFSDLDALAETHGLLRIKTMGDAYMAAAGVPDPLPPEEGAKAAAAMALALVSRLGASFPDVEVRVGMHTGPAVAGVIGRRTYAYDLWGDAVNVASRMESHGLPGNIQVSAATWTLIRDEFGGRHRGRIDIKGLGPMDTYLLDVNDLDVNGLDANDRSA